MDPRLLIACGTGCRAADVPRESLAAAQCDADPARAHTHYPSGGSSCR